MNLKQLSDMRHVEHIVFNMISNCFKRFMPDASVLLNTKEMQMFDVSRPWCLLEWLRGFDTFTADVDEDILEILNIIRINSICDRWWVEYKFV